MKRADFVSSLPVPVSVDLRVIIDLGVERCKGYYQYDGYVQCNAIFYYRA